MINVFADSHTLSDVNICHFALTSIITTDEGMLYTSYRKISLDMKLNKWLKAETCLLFIRFKVGFPFGKPASEFGFLQIFLGFLPEDPSLRWSIYLTIPGFPVRNPAKNLGYRYHFWVSRTSGNPVILSPVYL